MRNPLPAAAASILLLSLALAVGCGEDKTSGPGPPGYANNLTFERQDGSEVEFLETAYAWCGPWESGDPGIPAQTLHVIVGADLEHPEEVPAIWYLKVVVDDVVLGEPTTLPNTFIWDQPEGVELFVFDRPNELSSGEQDSEGELVFEGFRCGAGGEVAFSIDAVLGSEFGDLDPVAVTGTFHSPVGDEPYARVDR